MGDGGAAARRATARRGRARPRRAARRASRQREPEVVMHLAAQVDVRRSVADPGLRRAGQRRGHGLGARGRTRAPGPGGSCSPRPRDVRRTRSASRPARTTRIAPLSPSGTSKAAAEWYLEQYAAPARTLDALAADGERVRAAPGSARGGGCGRDLRRSIRGGAAGHGLRGRPPDARLHLRARRRGRLDRRRGEPRRGGAEHLQRHRGERARAGGGDRARPRAGAGQAG